MPLVRLQEETTSWPCFLIIANLEVTAHRQAFYFFEVVMFILHF